MLNLFTYFINATDKVACRIAYGQPFVRLFFPVRGAPVISVFPELPFSLKEFSLKNTNLPEAGKKFSSVDYVNLCRRVIGGHFEDERERESVTSALLQQMPQFGGYHTEDWRLFALSERIFFGLCSAPELYISSAAPALKDGYAASLVRQAIYFRRSAAKFKKSRHRVLYSLRQALSAICILTERKHLPESLKRLEAALSVDFNREGAFFTGNPSYQFNLTYELLVLRDTLMRAGVAVPHVLQKTLLKSCDFIAFVKRPDGKFPVIAGGDEGYSENTETLFSLMPVKANPKAFKIPETGYYKLEAKDVSLFADFKEKTSDRRYLPYERGTMAFEFSAKGKRIITACGTGEFLAPEWRKALRSRAALGVLTLDDSRIAPGYESGADTVIATANTQGIALEGVHSGYVKKFKLLYKRKLMLHKNGSALQGEDWVYADRDATGKLLKNMPEEGVIRFHIHPDTKAEISKSGSVSLAFKDQTVPGNWIFLCGSGKVTLEDSIYAGAGCLQSTKQIVILFRIRKDIEKIRWTFQYSAQNGSRSEKENVSDQEMLIREP